MQRGASRVAAARVLDIYEDSEEEEKEKEKEKERRPERRRQRRRRRRQDDLPEDPAHDSDFQRLQRQTLDHERQSLIMALNHLPHHDDCPVCAKLAAMPKSRRSKAVRAAVEATPGSMHNPLQPGPRRLPPAPGVGGGSYIDRMKALHAAKRGAPTPAPAGEAGGECRLLEAFETVKGADGRLTFLSRNISVCGAGPPVILPKE